MNPSAFQKQKINELISQDRTLFKYETIFLKNKLQLTDTIKSHRLRNKKKHFLKIDDFRCEEEFLISHQFKCIIILPERKLEGEQLIEKIKKTIQFKKVNKSKFVFKDSINDLSKLTRKNYLATLYICNEKYSIYKKFMTDASEQEILYILK